MQTMRETARSDAASDYRTVAGTFTARVRGVAPDRWDDPAPCEGWVARDVVRHLVEWFPGWLRHSAGIELPTGPGVDEDPLATWLAMSDAVQELLDDPATATTMIDDRHLGTTPLDRAIDMVLTGDVFLHTWDLARATGQDETLDKERCAVMLAGMEPMDEVLRQSGHYGPKTPVADDADVQTRLLAFIGRRP
jgi:uncharacterized protein (TIGR03086 family)